MSKHLRFGKLLGMLALMLTLSFAWSQAQNTSSAKRLLTFGFTVAANPGAQLGSDVMVTIPDGTLTATLTVPFQTNVSALIATFTSSPFSNVYGGVATPTGSMAVSGTSPALNYTTAKTWTVEAENYSFENYVITVTKAAASTAKDMLTFSGAWAKPWTGPCTAPANGVYLQTEPGAFSGTNVTFPVPYGSNLDALTVYFTISPLATASLTTATAYDFDADNNGVPEAMPLTVTSQSGATQVYSILPVVGIASVLDNLLAFAVPTTGSTVAINNTTQTIAVTVPYSTTTITPTFTVSPYAHVFTDPTFVTERCSGVTAVATPTATTTFDLWIRAEDPSEVSQYVVTVTKDAASTVNTLSALTADFSKVTCGTTKTGSIVGTIGASTVTFAVPYGVASLTVSAITKTSTLSTTTLTLGPPATVLTSGSTFTVTSESGVVKTYTVALTTGTASNNKQLLTYGFKQTINSGWGFTWPASAVYTNAVDQTLKKVSITVPYNTDLHNLKAFFTQSDFACVTIAESNGTFTAQTSDVTTNDHSNTLTYVVTAEDGTTERYEVMVTKELALTGNDLIGFKLTGLPYCFGGTFEAAGTYTGTNIAVSVKYGTSLTALAYSFTTSGGATPGPTVTGTANFTSPVTFTVTSQAGVAKTYTVTVTPRDENSNKKLLTYWFDLDYNSSLGGDAVGTVNEAAKTVEVWIPWEARASVTGLKASFTLSTNAMMTHSEDTQVLQVTNMTANDFTTPVAYTVWAENCSMLEYFVTVKVIPNTSTGISAFNFTSVGCGYDLVNKIDPYARRIYITLPYTMNISNLAPSSVVVSPGATIWVTNTDPKQPWSTAKDWTKGPITYTVQSDAGATANWTVYVTNPAAKQANIESWSFASGQIGAAVIDKTAHTVNITVANGTNLKNMSASITLSCGATICCNMGACAGTVIDFSDNLCHTCVVTAQDQTVTQDWTICLKYQDVVKPEVTTWSVMAYNCTDSVAVQSNELGRVFIVNESAINMLALPSPVVSSYNLADWNTTAPVAATAVQKMVDARLGAWAAVTAVNTPVFVKTNGLYSGTYWAFAVDASGNISCISAQKLYLDICDVEVATLCDLRGQPMVWRYTLTEEIFVTYEETRGTGNWKFMQNATCGILVEDKLGALPASYGTGAGVKGLKGMLDNSGPALKLVPVCCYAPTKSSTGNVVTPIDVTFENFGAVQSNRTYESMLVRLATPVKAANDYGQGANWTLDNLDLATSTSFGTEYWINSCLNTPLIGTAIPTIPAYYTGVRTNVTGGVYGTSNYGFITPRKAADIVPVSGPMLVYKPNPASINGVLPGQCKSLNLMIYNNGANLTVNNVPVSGVANITALYLDDAAATDGFHLVTPPAVPFSIAPWASQAVRVDFCPLVSGSKSTNLIVEYGVGKTLVIPINGTTLVAYPMPYYQTFNCLAAPNNEWCNTDMNLTTATHGWSGTYGANAETMIYSGWGDQYDGNTLHMRNRNNVGGVRQPVMVQTPGFVVAGTDPIVSFMEAQMAAYKSLTNFDMRSLSISTDLLTWTPIYSVASANVPSDLEGYRKIIVSLLPWVGQTVFFRFDMASGPGSPYNYYNIDNFYVEQRVTAPILTATPNAGAFGGVQVGATGTLAFSIKNTGISVLKIKKVEIVGAGFTLTDTNTYPYEVNATGGYAYSVGANGATIGFSANFMPTDIGVKTGKIVVTYGLYSDMTYEIPLTGEGLSCYTAAVANKGENWAPSQNVWYKYTADKFSIVEVNSCHVHQKIAVAGEYSWDTFLYVYKNCEGTLIASHDDMEAACPFNRASSSVTTVVNAGETIYIFWPLSFPTALHAYEGFYFNVNVSYPMDGDVCENAIPLTLPVVNHFGSTALFTDDYDQSPCSPFSNYMDGNDKVYTITLATEGYLTGNILGAYGSIHVLDVCPKEELTKDHCKAFVGGPNGGQFRKKIAAGTYFVIISTWAPPQTVDYLLNMSFESGSAVENGDLTSNMSVYPNPTNGKFTVSITNPEATDMTIELVNVSGQVVYRNEVKAAYSYNDEIDASQFAKGVYYLKVNNGREVKIEKVVVQ